MWRTTYPSLAVFAALLSATRAMADNLQCAGTGMNWYINLVGETPCQTYQKLRQICNTQYTVGVLTINTPPDRCTDQLSTCCCNSISFALSMLCLNCQQNIGNGIGIDAGAGAYTDYLESCSNPQLHAIPPNIQTAICNAHIKIEDDLYTNGFADGGWRYILSRDTILADNATANGNSFTHCPDISASSSSSASVTPSSSSSLSTSTAPTSGLDNLATNKKTLASGAIAGIAVGVIIIALVAATAVWWCSRKRRRSNEGLAIPLEDGMRRVGGEGVLDDNLVAHAYIYSNEPTNTVTSSSAAPRSVGDTSSVYDSQTSHGFHATQHLSITSGETLSNVYVGARGEAGPLPRKGMANIKSISTGNTVSGGSRADSEEPFLEGETDDRHHDAGPMSDVILHRSASGRLPPAYGEQI
ncbi:hypothetical protein B0H13DRAFT_1860308 [Mycena leptocephala]|nr:hypothetical protein B0H13DRAFT_1860308 [Mycena leptocephala]